MRVQGMIIRQVVSNDVVENVVVSSQWGRQGVLAGVLVGAGCVYRVGAAQVMGNDTMVMDLLALRGSNSKHETILKG